jgi:hypothetical protein
MNDRYSVPNSLYFILLALVLPWCSGAQGNINPLPPIDSLSDWEVNATLQQFTAQVRDLEALLTIKSQNTGQHRAALDESLNLANADSTISKPDRDSLARLLNTAKKEEKMAQKNLRQAQKAMALMEKAGDSDNDKKRKQLPKLWKELAKTNSLAYPEIVSPALEEPQKPVKPAKVKKPKKDKAVPKEDLAEAQEESVFPTVPPTPPPTPATKPQPGAVRTKKYDPAQDVMFNPPALPCRLAVDTRDELSGERYRRSAPVELFRHTPAALKNYLQGKPNVQCSTALASSGAYAYLHLVFTINDPNPRKAFGKLDKESLATLRFIDGTSYNLYNQVASEGTQNPETQAFTYQAQYSLPADALKKIRRTELDKIRIAWSSGYEDYEVQYVVLLLQQAECLFGN